MIKTYRKKHNSTKAIRFDGELSCVGCIEDFTKTRIVILYNKGIPTLIIPTSVGDQTATIGDYVVEDGTPYKSTVFTEMFEEVTS